MKTMLTLGTAVIVLSASGPARAATFLVDSKADSVDASPGDGICDDGQRRCTLRAAILETNALPGADGIFLTKYGSPYFLSIPGAGEDLGYEGDLDITDDLSIAFNLRFTGPPQPAIIDAGPLENDRVFDIHPGAQVTIQNLWIMHGHTSEGGGGILNRGTLSLVRTRLKENVAVAGGGIANVGMLTLVECSVFRNTSTVRAGGIETFGPLQALRSEITENSTDGQVGGLNILASGSAWLVNSTVSGNTAADGEVGIAVNTASTLRLDNCTVTGHGIGIRANGWIDNRWDDPPRPGDATTGTAFLQNTIVAKNSDRDCSTGPGGLIVSWGHNLDSDDTCSLNAAGDLPKVDPVLSPLVLSTGSPSRAHLLWAGSPAIDAGNDVTCPAVDQRGFARPTGWACDIGAVEAGASLPR